MSYCNLALVRLSWGNRVSVFSLSSWGTGGSLPTTRGRVRARAPFPASP